MKMTAAHSTSSRNFGLRSSTPRPHDMGVSIAVAKALHKDMLHADTSRPEDHRVAGAVPGWQIAPLVTKPLDPVRNVQRDIVYLVDSDSAFCSEMESKLLDAGCDVENFSDCAAFLAYYRPGRAGCLVVDSLLLGVHGTDLISTLKDNGAYLPTIVTSTQMTCTLVVQAMRAGAFDIVEKPVFCQNMMMSLRPALLEQERQTRLQVAQTNAMSRISTLTSRQHQIMELVIAGHPSKNIAADLGISQRTVENHRAAIGRKTGSKSLSALIRTALCANCTVRG